MNSSPNPQLVEALNASPDAFNYKDWLEERMKALCKSVQADSFTLRPPPYNRNTHTVAMLLAGDSALRQLAIDNHIDLEPFDDVVRRVQALILNHANKPAPAKKVADALRKLCGL